MSAIPALLWKEWREQRSALQLVCLFSALLIAGFGVFFPAKMFSDMALVIAMLPLMVALLTFGGDLLGGPEKARSISFLERLPRGLQTAYFAKLALVLALTISLPFFGIVITLCILFALGQPIPSLEGSSAILFPLIILSLWCFMVSPWAPRGPLSLPTAGFFLVLCAWPVSLAFAEIDWYGLPPYFPLFFLPIALIAAIPVSWLSYVKGLSLIHI